MVAETLHRFWQMLAHNQGQMLNAAQLAAGLGISGQTVARYLDIMVDLPLHRSVDLRRIEVEFIRQAQIRRPFAMLQRKLQHDYDVERPQYDRIIQYSIDILSSLKGEDSYGGS